MRVQRVLLSVALTISLTLAAAVTALAAPGTRYVVVFKTDQLPADAGARIANAGGRTHRAIGEIGVVTASGDAAFAARIGRDPGVLVVGLEHMYKLPPHLLVPAGLDPPVGPAADGSYALQWNIRRIGAPAAWARLPKVVPGAVVAVLDTGVMHTHPDLEGQIVAFKATSYCVTSVGSPSIPSYPIYSTFIDFDAHPSWTPADGCTDGDPFISAHGTHVAGTIAARFGGGAVVGVAPQARVAAYKVFDRFRFTDPNGGLVDDIGAFDGPVWSAMVDAAVSGYPVISMSLGGLIDRSTPDGDASWHAWNRVARLATRLGTLIVAAAGNDAVNLNGPIASIPSDLPSVMSTSATSTSLLVADDDGDLLAAPGSDMLAFYSNFGGPVDIAGPGGDCGPDPNTCDPVYLILSTFIVEEPGPNFGQHGYAYYAGTSMATPHVSAVAAVAYRLHPSWKPDHVRRWLLGTAENIGKQKFFGAGLVNMDAATR